PTPFGRDDQREVTLLDVRVGAAGPVTTFDVVPVQPHPVVLVDHAGRERADIRVVAGEPHEVRMPPARKRRRPAFPRTGPARPQPRPGACPAARTAASGCAWSPRSP